MTLPIALVVHGHFYQPPRENPWSDHVEPEPSASPFHDWNARINAECYRANAFARVHDAEGRIQSIISNYEHISFNFGPTLARWIEQNDVRTYARLASADRAQLRRLRAGGAVAQAYSHAILPLATALDRRTQMLWGLADFRRRFGRKAEGMWLPETAANTATLETAIEVGLRFVILAPEQVAAVRAPGADWSPVDRDTVDTGRLYRWSHPDGSGRTLAVAVFDGPLSRSVAFGDATRDAAKLVGDVIKSAERSRAREPRLVLCASDGELYGHHKKFADLTLAFAAAVEAPRNGIELTNLSAYLEANPPTWEMLLAAGPDGQGTSWSCVHGVARWARHCGCTMAPAEWGWNQRWRAPLRAALDHLQRAAAEFYEAEAADLLVDAWAARDAYGEVVDGSITERDALIATFGTPALAAGGAAARDRARLLLELQRATLLMYASCGWYFDDITGLESSLVLRLAAYTADLMEVAGGTPPRSEMLDILASAKSNRAELGTGADVFRRMALERVTPARVLAETAFAELVRQQTTGRAGRAPRQPAGFSVELGDEEARRTASGLVLAGGARVVSDRTGASQVLGFEASWDAANGFRCVVGDDEVLAPEDLGPESRAALLPELLPWLEREGEPLLAARAALALGRGIIGESDGQHLENRIARAAYARIFLRLLALGRRLAGPSLEAALALLDMAGPALAEGTQERLLAEELLAEQMQTPAARERLAPLAKRLGFAVEPPV